jgi:hypothetical protein
MTGQPDLTTPQGRSAYLKELGQVARGWRMGGFLVMLVSFFALVAERWVWADAPGWLHGVGIAGLLVGAALLLVAIVVRTRYHARRMKAG